MDGDGHIVKEVLAGAFRKLRISSEEAIFSLFPCINKSRKREIPLS